MSAKYIGSSLCYLSTKVKKKQYFITTPIFYVNASPHLGHLYTAVIADAVHRFQALIHGPNMNHLFSTGTDEHGTKIQQAALAHKQTPDKYCAHISQEYRALFDQTGIEYTKFIRTSDEEHKVAVQKFWQNLDERGHIYSTKYSGWYCVPDETFLTESQIKDVPGLAIKVSAESGHTVEWTEEQNYMFRLGNLRDDLVHWIRNADVVTPSKYQSILEDWIMDVDLPDVSISRPSSRVHWGVPVPSDDTQTVYVWLDALVNYLTVAGYPDIQGEPFQAAWPPDLHVLGKDILKFHGVYWPAFLIAAGLEPPRRMLVHGHWTVDGEKMSKSKGNVISPQDRIPEYGTEGLRYFLLREGVPHSDSNYSDVKVTRILNSELADTLGNLLSRCCGANLNPNQKFPALKQNAFEEILKDETAKKLIVSVELLADTVQCHFEDYTFYKGVSAIVGTLRAANLFFETQRPWELRKRVEDTDRLDVILHVTMETLRVCGILLQPIVPELSARLLDKLNVSDSRRLWRDAVQISWKHTPSERHVSKDLAKHQTVLYRRIVSDKEQLKKGQHGV